MPAWPAMSEVYALIVTYNHADEIAACIDAALAQPEVSVVVVDNASEDGTLDRLAAYREDPRVRVVARPVNDGYAPAMNAGLDAVGGPGDVLLLNPDVTMAAGCVAALEEHLEARATCGAAAALLRNEDGSLQRFAVRDPDLRALAMTSTHVGRRLDARRGARAAAHRYYEELFTAGIDRPVAVDCPAAACVLVRRNAIPEPFMDERLPLFFNDADLWHRLRASGWAVEICPSADAVHLGGTSIRRTDPVRIRAEWVVSLRRHVGARRGRRGRALVAAMLLADVAGSVVLIALRRANGETAPWLLGTLGGLGLPYGPRPWLSGVRRVVPDRRRER